MADLRKSETGGGFLHTDFREFAVSGRFRKSETGGGILPKDFTTTDLFLEQILYKGLDLWYFPIYFSI